jgi:P4 family phage/plasmid primase-like protien
MTKLTVVDGTAPWTTTWDPGHPCPVCAGHPGKRTKATKCNGGMNPNGDVAYCTVREAAGKALAHRLGGDCGCGIFHPKLPLGNGNGGGHVPTGDELNGYHHGPDGMPTFTDTRNAQRLADHFGEHMRKDHTRGKKALDGWRLWDGTRWGLDQTEVAMLRAKAVVDKLPDEIDAYTAIEPLPANLLAMVRGNVLACESTGRLHALLQNAGSLLPATHETWDPDPYLLNCRNGTVDLHTGELLEHRPDRWQSKLAPVEYDPECPTPVWDAFLERIFAGDQELIAFVQRAVGLSLVGQVIEHVLFVMYGGGGNGKGTFINVWLQILGEYGRTAALDLFTETANPQHPTSIAELNGVRFVATGEGRANRFDETIIKMLTGGDDRNARYMHQDSFVYTPADTFWLATNHQPSVSRISDGLKRRVRMIPFKVRIPDADMDGDFLDKLRPEYPGVLAWAVRGCLKWQSSGLGRTAAVDVATDSYWQDMDTMATFLADRCVVGPDLFVGATELYKAYEAWNTETGERPTSQRFFGIRLGERGFTRKQFGKDRRWTWFGLRLRGDGDLFDGPDSGPPPASHGELDRETPFEFRDSTESAAELPPERSERSEKRELGEPNGLHSSVSHEIKSAPGEPIEPIIPFNVRAGADEDSKSGSVRAHARETDGLMADPGSMGSPEIKPAPSSVLPSNAANDANHPNAERCASWPVRTYPPNETQCPLCHGSMQHRPHGEHWDHECLICPVKFRDADPDQPTPEDRP